MRHLRVVPRSDEVTAEPGNPGAQPEIAERMHAARSAGNIEAALYLWGARVRASGGADVEWRTTRPAWRSRGRLDSRWSPVWLPTAEAQRKKRVRPLRLASLFDRAA
jgi:hypothetical protein